MRLLSFIKMTVGKLDADGHIVIPYFSVFFLI